MSVCLLTIVDVRLTADWTDHVANVSLSDDDFKVMLKTITADTALTSRRVQHLTTPQMTQIRLEIFWLGGITVRASDLQSGSCGFDSQSGRYHVT